MESDNDFNSELMHLLKTIINQITLQWKSHNLSSLFGWRVKFPT